MVRLELAVRQLRSFAIVKSSIVMFAFIPIRIDLIRSTALGLLILVQILTALNRYERLDKLRYERLFTSALRNSATHKVHLLDGAARSSEDNTLASSQKCVLAGYPTMRSGNCCHTRKAKSSSSAKSGASPSRENTAAVGTAQSGCQRADTPSLQTPTKVMFSC